MRSCNPSNHGIREVICDCIFVKYHLPLLLTVSVSKLGPSISSCENCFPCSNTFCLESTKEARAAFTSCTSFLRSKQLAFIITRQCTLNQWLMRCDNSHCKGICISVLNDILLFGMSRDCHSLFSFRSLMMV